MRRSLTAPLPPAAVVTTPAFTFTLALSDRSYEATLRAPLDASAPAQVALWLEAQLVYLRSRAKEST